MRVANVIAFKPRREFDAQASLHAFVTFAREKLTAFGEDLPFDDIVWDVTEKCSRKGMGDKRERITFCTLNSVGSEQPVQMSDAFRPFAQAYMRQMQALQPIVSHGQRIAALRALEAALAENGVALSPIYVDTNILNRAAQLLNEHFKPATAYRNGVQLGKIAQYMSDIQLTAVPLAWKNPIKRPLQGARVGQDFDEKRAQKMPSQAALEALPHIFRKATAPRDVLVSSVAAILCSAPDRISEVLLLPNACETSGLVDDEGVYGIRWWPAKGAEPMVKWILPSMIDVVKEALAKIRSVTESAREVARWYEENPDKLFLPNGLEGLRSYDELSLEDLRRILWGDQSSVDSARDWCKQKSIHVKSVGVARTVSFSAVEKSVISMLPSAFPVLNNTDLTYSKSLMVVLKNALGVNRPTYLCVVEPVNIQHVNDALGSRSEHGRKSMFDTFQCTEPDGSPVKVTTHQFRHYLNTLAQAGGLSQIDIAKWSGRKDIRQNEAYDHVSSNEMLQIIRDSVGDVARSGGPLAAVPPQYLIRRDEFSRLIIPTAHTTDLGYCVHDYTMAPCLIHRDCINCQEHVCVKGDAAKTARLRQQLEEAQRLLVKTEAAVQEGHYGSDKWLEHHRLTTERLCQLCAIMDDPNVPSGAIIQLNNVKSASRIEQASMVRAQLTSLPRNGNDGLFEEFRMLLKSGEAVNED